MIEDFATGNIVCRPIDVSLDETKNLTVQDIYHLIWNLWKHLGTMSREASCRFAKHAFPLILQNINERPIYSKMSESCHTGPIQKTDANEPLVKHEEVMVITEQQAVI